MYYSKIDYLLKPKKIMETFFEKIGGQDRIIIGTGGYIIPINYETDEKRVIVNESVPVFNLKNNNLVLFQEALERYVRAFFESERNWANPIYTCQTYEDRLVYAISAVLTNASAEDHNHPDRLVDRYTNFLRDKTFEKLQFSETLRNVKTLNECDIEVQLAEQGEFQETPDAILFKVKKGNIQKKLPRIAFGLDKDRTAYIYGIQGYQENDDSKEMKKINRKRYQVNNSTNIPEDYKSIFLRQEPYAYISLFSFLCMLKEKGIKKVRMPDFLPERYYSKEYAIAKREEKLDKKYANGEVNGKEAETMRRINKKSENDLQRIQYTRTNKFLAYMSRMECDIPGLVIEETPAENNCDLVVDISKMEPAENGNAIFYELSRKIKEMMKTMQKEDNEYTH